MPRHNYLIQRSCKPNPDGHLIWLDTSTSNHPMNRGPGVPPMDGRGRGVPDSFGNDGFATIEEARTELAYFLRTWGHEADYRIIQIIS